MDRTLQQRLVGVGVLAAFALLIAPVLFDADGRIPEKITNIPPQPKRPDTSRIEPMQPIVINVPELPSIEEVQPEETAEPVVITARSETAAPTPSERVTSNMWSVQVASFRDVAKANAFRDVLREKNFEAYVREKLLSDGTLFTQVFVGPVSEKPSAEALKGRIKEEFGEQGLVVNYRQ